LRPDSDSVHVGSPLLGSVEDSSVPVRSDLELLARVETVAGLLVSKIPFLVPASVAVPEMDSLTISISCS